MYINIAKKCKKWLRLKNAGLIAFNGAITLATIKMLTDGIHNCYFQYYLFYVLTCSLISIFLSLAALSARLKHKEQEILNHKSQNLLFFWNCCKLHSRRFFKRIKN
jgi:hypothetical protein